MDLSIIIVNWNVVGLLQRCLESVYRSLAQSPHLSSEVIVVDNASADDSVAMVQRGFPQVTLMANNQNLGFTVANNQGMRLSQGRYILLLNPDTEVMGQALAHLVAYMEANPRIGAVGPQLRNSDGSVQSSRRRFPTLHTALVESTLLQHYFPHGPLLRSYYILDRPDDQTQEVDWVVGAAIMVRREVLDQVGLLDERFFMYSEELDWCYRIKQAGWQVAYLPTAQVVHHYGQSSTQDLPHRHIHFQTSKLRFFRKHHGFWAYAALRWFILATYLFQMAEEGLKLVLGHKPTLRRDRLGTYWQVLRSGLRT